ncbi:MAG: hypothetical protein E7459_07860 [Ruminococcaceae bacterium]|nr:hypothetical protein [Oscillospiraceae bacterium]
MMFSSFLTAGAEDTISGLADAGLVAFTGYGVVFFGIVLLMSVIIVVGNAMKSRKKVDVPSPAPAVNQTDVPQGPAAPGSAGQIKLYDTDPKTAAMLMAIVADKMGKPINELRFISIKEVK